MNRSFESGRRGFLVRSLAGGVAAIAASLGVDNVFAQTIEPARARMDAGEPSATARGAALSRAVHQVIDFPRILEDPFALPILGSLTPGELQTAVDRQSRGLRASIVMRSRYAEDRLSAAVARGVRQYVVRSGSGYLRLPNPYARAGLRVFEVDHPATQRFKRDRLDKARIPSPPKSTFVPIDFETQTLAQQMAEAGFRFDQPAFFSMLGVVIYLTDAAVMETMRVVGSCVSGSEIVFLFSTPDELLTEAQRLGRQRSMAFVAALGEPWLTFYEPSALAGTLRASGFSTAEVFAPADANRAYFADPTDGLRISNAHMMSARVERRSTPSCVGVPGHRVNDYPADSVC